jgi:von Willebrand factor type A domain-containing protein
MYWTTALVVVVPIVMVFFMVLLLGFHLIFWPSLRAAEKTIRSSQRIGSQSSINEARIEPGLNFGGVNVYVSPDKIIATATIKLLDKEGKESFIEDVSPRNFTVEETYTDKAHLASIHYFVKAEINKQVKAILLIDNSGSMEENSGVPRSGNTQFRKTQIVKKAATDFLGLTAREGTQIAVLPFAGDKITKEDFIKSVDGHIWWSREQSDDLKKAIRGLRPHGDTPLWDAIDIALDQFRQFSDESYKVIICLTDGMDTRSRIPVDYLIEKAQGNHIPIYTLGYGEGVNLHEEQLIKLSYVSGAGKIGMGSFIRIHPREWIDKLKDIKMNIENLYDLSWEPTWKIPGAHVRVKVKARFKIFGEVYNQDWEFDYIYPEKIDK